MNPAITRNLLANRWFVGARPKTLAASVVPVVVGWAVAHADNPYPFFRFHFSWARALLTLVVALGMQIGANYINDYADGVKGADANRVGPVRLVASGLATPRQVLFAAIVSFGIAAGAGIWLASWVSWWLLLVGLLCICAGVFYTLGPRPYGYAGFGEVAVFIFFGVVAVVGTEYAIIRKWTSLGVLASIPVGLLAVALLVVNNLRDIPTDAAVGKRTLAVRLGDKRTRTFYSLCVIVPFAAVLLVAGQRPWALLCWAALPVALLTRKPVADGAAGRDLIPVLQRTARLQMIFGGLLALGIWL